MTAEDDIRRFPVGLTLATAIALGILVALGVWQLQRLAWKEALIASVAERTTRAPVEAPRAAEWPGLDRDALEYRHVEVTGRFDQIGRAHV